MSRQPTIVAGPSGGSAAERFTAAGSSFVIRDWRGSGPARLHVHHEDDEAWHVLEGTLRFRFADRTVEVAAGGSVFVPAGVAHTYEALEVTGARYLVILTPRIDALIAELQRTPDAARHAEVYRRHASEIIE